MGNNTKSINVNLGDSIYNVFRLYQKIWSFNKRYVCIGMFVTLLLALKPFSGLLFIKLILEELSQGKDIKVAIVFVLMMAVTNGLLSLLDDAYRKYDEQQIELIKTRLLSEVENLTMNIPYEKFQNTKTLDNHAKVLEIFNPTQAAYMDMRNSILVFKSLISFVLQMIGLTMILISLNWLVAVGLIVACVISIAIDAIAAEKEFKVWDISLVHFGRKVGYLQNISMDKEHAKELRNYSLSNWVTRKMKSITDLTMKEVRGTVKTFSITSMISNSLMLIVKSALYIYILYLAMQGVITLADIVVYFNSISIVITVLISISYCLLLIYKSGLYTSVYFRFLEDHGENLSEARMKEEYITPIEADIGLDPNVPEESFIVFENVWFKYPDQSQYTLKDINITINSNQTTAIVGDNGAGKTTLVKLILRLYTPSKGKILLNGKDINLYAKEEYYKLVTAVFQDFNILNYSLIENITFDRHYSQEAMDKVISDLGMNKMVEQLPDSYDTVLGKMFDESGIELSAGQGQKIAIARALIKESKMLIMDEPTAMLSPIAEYEIYTHLRSLTEGKTAIYISHRMSSCKFCDSIIVLDQGQVAEQGTHHELMELQGIYCDMFQIQAKFYNELQPA